jgi:hypothetical protein
MTTQSNKNAVETVKTLTPAQKLEALKKAEAEMMAKLAAMQNEVKAFEAAEALNILKDEVKTSFADCIKNSETAEELFNGIFAVVNTNFAGHKFAAITKSFAEAITGSDNMDDLQTNLLAMMVTHFPKVSKSTGRSRSGGLIVKGYQAIIDAARADIKSNTKIGVTRDALVELTGASPVTITAHMPKLPGFFRYSSGVFSTATPDEAQTWLDAKTTTAK